MIINLNTTDELSSFIANNGAALVYFSTETCNVCKSLKPKLREFLSGNYPKFVFGFVDAEKSKSLTAEYNIFAVPTVLFFFGGREFLRKSRFINLAELNEELSRPYEMYFE